MFGDTSLRTISADISRDEIVHVAAHTQVAKTMGLSPSKKMERLSRQTAIWLTETLDVSGADEKGYPAFWVKQSWQLLKEGRADGLTNTKRTRIPAFFEMDNRSQAIYGRTDKI